MDSSIKSNCSKKNTMDTYIEKYIDSVQNNDSFWEGVAKRITWFSRWNRVSNVDYNNASIKWFEGATLNASYNCIDRHVLSGSGKKTAILWEGNDFNDTVEITYDQL